MQKYIFSPNTDSGRGILFIVARPHAREYMRSALITTRSRVLSHSSLSSFLPRWTRLASCRYVGRLLSRSPQCLSLIPSSCRIPLLRQAGFVLMQARNTGSPAVDISQAMTREVICMFGVKRSVNALETHILLDIAFSDRFTNIHSMVSTS